MRKTGRGDYFSKKRARRRDGGWIRVTKMSQLLRKSCLGVHPAV